MPRNALCRNKECELIKVTEKEGRQVVSARELYTGLGLNKAVWKRWYESNIEENEYFKENIDWVGFNIMLNGNETKDFAITLDFAKHIAMMARTERSHEYRNYFIKCEQALKKQQARRLTPQEELRLHYQVIEEHAKEIESVREEVTEVREEFKDLKDNMPLFGEESDKLQAEVRKVGVATLGGYKSNAYNDNSLRGKVYKDIQNQLKREFGVERYKAIKRCQLDLAMKIVHNYKAPTVLVTEISNLNNQMRLA